MNMLRSITVLPRHSGNRAGTVCAARPAWLLLALVLAASVPGAPDDSGVSTQELKKHSLEELVGMDIPTVYGASKHEQKLTEAPSSVSIVTHDDIQQFGHRTLADVLRSVRGFYVTSDRSYSYVGLRGVNRPGDYGGGILLMINGHRLNDPVADEAFNGGEFPLDVDLIERVEVIRGPGSTLYGNNAFFTVINVITRGGRDFEKGEASFTAGSLDTYSGRVSLGHRFTNGVEMLFSGTYLDSAGHDALFYPDFSGINNGEARNLDGEKRQQAFLSLSYRDLTLEGVYGHRVKSLPTAAYGSWFNLSPNQTLDERAYLELRYRHEFDDDWLVEGRVGLDHYRYDGFGPFDGTPVGLPGQPVWNHVISEAQWWGGELQVSRTFFQQHRLSLGVDGRQGLKTRQYNYYVNPDVPVDDINTPNSNFGFYAQDEFALRTNLLLNAGVRLDHFTSFGNTVNPRAGLIFSPWTITTLKLLYGQAYRAPNAYEFDYNSVGYVRNHALQPETIRTYELVWEQQLSQPLRLSTSLFYNELQDQITQVDETADPAVGGYIFRNVGAVDIKGFETELEARWESGVRGRVSYTFADARDRATGARLSNSPRHVGKLNLAVPLYLDKVYGGLELQALSRRGSVDGLATTPGFVVGNLTLFSRELVRGLEFSAGVYNLLDTHWSDPVGPDFTQQFIEQDGRAFRLKLTYRF